MLASFPAIHTLNTSRLIEIRRYGSDGSTRWDEVLWSFDICDIRSQSIRSNTLQLRAEKVDETLKVLDL